MASFHHLFLRLFLTFSLFFSLLPFLWADQLSENLPNLKKNSFVVPNVLSRGVSLYNGEVSFLAEQFFPSPEMAYERLRTTSPVPISTFYSFYYVDDWKPYMDEKFFPFLNDELDEDQKAAREYLFQMMREGRDPDDEESVPFNFEDPRFIPNLLMTADFVDGLHGDINDNNFNHEFDRPGVSIHWAFQHAANYFGHHFGWWGLDGKGTFPIKAYYVLSGGASGWAAGFDYSKQYFIFFHEEGYGISPLLSVDVIGHEYTHGIQNLLGRKEVPRGEEGAIDEGFGDVFGNLIKWDIQKEKGNWILNEPTNKWPYTRDLSNPKKYHQPTT